MCIRDSNLTTAMQFIRDRGDLTPQIEQQAASLYRHSVERGLVTGRSIRGVSAACVYIAAREARIPRKIEEIAEAFDMRTEVEQRSSRELLGWLRETWVHITLQDHKSTSKSSIQTYNYLLLY